MLDETAGITQAAESTPTPSESTETTQPASQEQTRVEMNRALRSGRGPSRAASKETTADASAATREGDAPTSDPTEPKAYTQAELDKLIQAETDRRESKRAREAQAAAKREEERQLRQNDPYEYARRKEQEDQEQSAEATTLKARLADVESLTTSYDRAVLDPLFLALPKEDQNALLKENGHLLGMESRQAMTKGALKVLEKNWKAEGAKEAEARLRVNPAFRKQLMNQLRGAREEPEIVSGAPKGAATPDMNAWLRTR